MNRKQAPAITDAVDYTLHLKPYRFFRLDNGVEVYAVHAGAQEVIQIEWVFSAGSCYETKQSVAATANYLLKNGTQSKTAFQLDEAFEFYGGYCNRSCFTDTSQISLHSLTRHIDRLLPLVREMISESVIPESELSIYKQNAAQRLKVNLLKGDFVAGRLIDHYVYGPEHPSGRYTTLDDIESLQREDILAFYQQYYQHGHCRIFVSGALPDHIESILNAQFGDLPFVQEAPTPPLIIREASIEKKYRITNDPSSVQGAIRLAIPFPERRDPDFKKAQVLNILFGGYFGSRLMSNIREDKGYTYGIYSYIQNQLHDTAWIISTEAGKDVCEDTVKEIYAEMHRLCEEAIPEEELSLVRNYMIGTTLSEMDGPFSIMAKWKNMILKGLDEGYFYDTIDTVKRVSADELQAVARRFFKPDNFYELIVY
ncbi:MAG: M16 family metallopeptidase [Ferruginibacter sp.]